MNAEYEDVETEEHSRYRRTRVHWHHQRFYYLDLLVASKLLSVRTDDHLYLVQIQGEDRDMDQHSMVFDAI